jgi:hypothetical protein
VFADNVAGEGAKFSVCRPRFREEEADVEVVVPVEPEEIRRDLTGVSTVMLAEDEDAVRLFDARALVTRTIPSLRPKTARARSKC